MTYFKINLSSFDEKIKSNILHFNRISEYNKSMFTILKDTEYYWLDISGRKFVEKIKQDEYSLNNFIDYMKIVYGLALEFTSSLRDNCKKAGYPNAKILKFDNTRFNIIDNYFTQIINILNNSLTKLNYSINNYNLADLTKVYKEKEKISKVITQVKELQKSINDFNGLVTTSLNNAKSRRNKISKNKTGISLIQYDYKISNPIFTKINSEI